MKDTQNSGHNVTPLQNGDKHGNDLNIDPLPRVREIIGDTISILEQGGASQEEIEHLLRETATIIDLELALRRSRDIVIGDTSFQPTTLYRITTHEIVSGEAA